MRPGGDQGAFADRLQQFGFPLAIAACQRIGGDHRGDERCACQAAAQLDRHQRQVDGPLTQSAVVLRNRQGGPAELDPAPPQFGVESGGTVDEIAGPLERRLGRQERSGGIDEALLLGGGLKVHVLLLR